MKTNLEQQVDVNKTLLNQQSILRVKYDDAIKINQDVQQKQKDLMLEIEMMHNAILTICPNKQLQAVENIGKAPQNLAVPNVRINTISPTLSSTPPPQMITSRTMSVPTAAALKQGVGFPLNNLRKDDTGRILSTQCTLADELLNECGICKKCNDQHLLAKCDTCHLYYHLGCLNPPLTRHPKKSKLYAWQCSECDNEDSGPETKIMPKGPRRSRIRYSKDGLYHTDLNDSFGSESSLVNALKSDESFQYKNSNGTDNIALSEHELEEHVKETLNVDTTSSTTNALDLSSTPRIPEKKKSNGKGPAKAKKSNAIKSPTSAESPSPAVNNVNNKNEDAQKSDETPEPMNLSGVEQKKPKRGRPPKRTLSQISNDLQKLHEGQSTNHENEVKQEVIVKSPEQVNSEKKMECPQYRAFADIPNSSIPYPLPSSNLPKLADEPEIIPITQMSTPNSSSVTLNLPNGLEETKVALTNGDGLIEYSSNSSHHKHKKRKSHKRRHSHSPSSGEPGLKKHKKKHKHRDHDTIDQFRPDDPIDQPRIKIKFKAILQTAGDDKKPPKFLWHVPNNVENDVIDGNSGTSSMPKNLIENQVCA